MTTTVIELVTYKLKNGVSPDQLAATHEGVNAFLKAQEGFYYRSMSQDEDNTMVDICYWKDMETAKAASDAFMNSPACKQLIELCDMESVVMKHLPMLTEAMTGSCEAA